DYTWAPSGNTLAWSMTDEDRTTSSIFVWQAADGEVRRVTPATFNEFSPSWDPEGNFLYYLSNRDYQPQLSQDEFNFATARQTGIFALALRRDVKNPFPLENDEVAVDTARSAPAAAAPAPASPAPKRDSAAAPAGVRAA